jgi:hypothetical protein
MSWLLNSIPYFLAGATIILGLVQLRKEWDEYGKFKWLRRIALTLLIIVGALTFVSLRFDNVAKADEKAKAENDIRELKAKVQAANDAQRDNTQLFFDKFGGMSKEVGDLKAEVKTEALQKKLSSVQAELLNTQRAMARPKAELTFTFIPFNNPPINSSSSAAPVTDIDLPINQDGSVHVEAGALNMTSTDAADVDLNIQICDGCKYAKEPADTVKLTGFPDTIRFLKAQHVEGMQVLTAIILDIIPPPNTKNFQVGFGYRCSTCVFTKNPSWGMVHIAAR